MLSLRFPSYRTRAEHGSNSSRRSYPDSSTSSDPRFFNVNYTNVQNPNVQYQTRNEPSPRTFQHHQPYPVPAPDPRPSRPLTQENLYANHTQCVDPIFSQQREQQQDASRVAAAQSLGIDMTDPVFASVARERRQASRPMEAYAAESGPRYLSVEPLQPVFASVARERPQDYRPMGAYTAEPGPRYLSVAPLQDSRRQDRRGSRH